MDNSFIKITVSECVSFCLCSGVVSGTLYHEEYIVIIPSHCISTHHFHSLFKTYIKSLLSLVVISQMIPSR